MLPKLQDDLHALVCVNGSQHSTMRRIIAAEPGDCNAITNAIAKYKILQKQ